MNDILEKVNIMSRNDDKKLYFFLKEQLRHESKDVNFWLSLAITIVAPPFGDEETSIIFINKALAIDNNNPIALIILAHVYEYNLGGIDDMLLHQIKNLHTNSNEINSMLKYVASWSYSDGKKNDSKMEEQLLRESILLCDKHVWNYKHLARLYRRQQRYLEINNLLKKALKNVKTVYYEYSGVDITNIDKFINEHIKGTHITDCNVGFIHRDILPPHLIIFYTIVTPFFNFYHYVKIVILRSMNIMD